MLCVIESFFFFFDFIKNSHLMIKEIMAKNELFHVLYLVTDRVLHRTNFILQAKLGGEGELSFM